MKSFEEELKNLSKLVSKGESGGWFVKELGELLARRRIIDVSSSRRRITLVYWEALRLIPLIGYQRAYEMISLLEEDIEQVGKEEVPTNYSLEALTRPVRGREE